MLYADVSTAYFYVKAVQAMYFQFTEEDEAGDQERFAATLEESGYIRGRANPCILWHPDEEVALMVHGDDFIAVGEAKNFKSLQQTIEDKYKLKTQSLGGDKDASKRFAG